MYRDYRKWKVGDYIMTVIITRSTQTTIIDDVSEFKQDYVNDSHTAITVWFNGNKHTFILHNDATIEVKT